MSGWDDLDEIDRQVKAEYEATKKTRFEDPDRYRAAKKLVDQRRTFWRQVGDAMGLRDEYVRVTNNTDGAS